MVTDEWVSLNLYDAATLLRMSASGGGDPLPDEDEAMIRRVLADRVGPAWRDRGAKTKRADDALRAFVWAALAETARCHLAPPNWHTFCGIDAAERPLAYDTVSFDDGPGWCEWCVWLAKNPNATRPGQP